MKPVRNVCLQGVVFFLFFGTSAWGRIDTVRVQDFSFVPAGKVVLAGDTVLWRVFQQCCLAHTVTRLDPPMSWDSGPLALGATFQLTFPDTGLFQYSCSNHEYLGMIGSITVQPRPVPLASKVSAMGGLALLLLGVSLSATAFWILERRRKTA